MHCCLMATALVSSHKHQSVKRFFRKRRSFALWMGHVARALAQGQDLHARVELGTFIQPASSIKLDSYTLKALYAA